MEQGQGTPDMEQVQGGGASQNITLAERVYKGVAFSCGLCIVLITPLEAALVGKSKILQCICIAFAVFHAIAICFFKYWEWLNQTNRIVPATVLEIIIGTVGVIPWGYKPDSMLRLLIFLRLIYIVRLVQDAVWYDCRLRGQIRWRMILRFIHLIFIYCYWIYIWACILYLTAYFQRRAKFTWLGKVEMMGLDFTQFKSLPFMTVFSVAAYFSFVTIYTAGYGDIHPQSVIEIWIVMLMLFLSALLLLLLAFMVNSLITNCLNEREEAVVVRGREEREHELQKEERNKQALERNKQAQERIAQNSAREQLLTLAQQQRQSTLQNITDTKQELSIVEVELTRIIDQTMPYASRPVAWQSRAVRDDAQRQISVRMRAARTRLRNATRVHLEAARVRLDY